MKPPVPRDAHLLQNNPRPSSGFFRFASYTPQKRDYDVGQRRIGRRVRQLMRCLLGVSLLFSLSVFAAQDDREYYDLDITVPAVAGALNLLAEQTGRMLLFDYDLAKDRRVHPLVGRYTIDEALAVMLAGSGLMGALTQGQIITISRAGKSETTQQTEQEMEMEMEMEMENDTSRKSWLGRIGAALAAVMLAAPGTAVHAQETGERSWEEVVVTARRTEENVQHVPLAVTAFTAEALETKGVKKPQDLGFVAPSLTAIPSSSQLSGGFSLRGQLLGVTTYFNEVPLGSSTAAGTAGPFFDVASVQVLNGPQGTLFGRANTAGAILVSSQRVNLNEFEANVNVSLGDYSRQDFGGMVNLPIIDNELGVRLAVNRERRDGFVEVVNSAEELQENNSDSLRLSVDWVAGDSGFANFTTLNYYEVDQTPRPNLLTGYNPGALFFNLPSSIDAPLGAIFGPAVFGAPCGVAVSTRLSPDMSTCIDGRLQTAATFGPRLDAELARIQNDGVRKTLDVPGFIWRERMEQVFLINNMEYDFGEVGPTTLTANYIFGYRRTRGQGAFGLDGVGGMLIQSYFFGSGGALGQANTRDGVVVPEMGPWAKTTSHELRFSGTFGEDLVRWTVGGYLERSPVATTTRGSSNYIRLFSGITEPDLGFTGAGMMLVGGSGARQEAVFAEATINLSSLVPAIQGLHLTLGGRRSDDKEVLETRAELATYPSGLVVAGDTVSKTRNESDGDNTNITLDAQLTDDLLVYLAFREGYRPGGINAVPGAEGLPLFEPVYGPEIVEDVEFGVKYNYTIGEASGYLNAAFYRSDYFDIHKPLTALSETGGLALYTANVAAAEINGMELLAALSLGNWEFDGMYSYTDAGYTDYKTSDPLGLILPGDPRCLPESPGALCLIDLSGDPFTATPEHQASLTARYHLPLAAALGDLSLALTTSYRSEMNIGSSVLRLKQVFPGEERNYTVDAYTVFNLRAEWLNVMDTNMDIAFSVDNLTDETYAVDGLFVYDFLGFSSKAYGDPRTFELSLNWSF